jgi:hypothetical protein
VSKKTEGELADSNCVDGKAKGKGQRRVFGSPPAQEARVAVMRRPFGSVIMTMFNFKEKGCFTPKLGGHVLTRNFNTCQG